MKLGIGTHIELAYRPNEFIGEIVTVDRMDPNRILYGVKWKNHSIPLFYDEGFFVAISTSTRLVNYCHCGSFADYRINATMLSCENCFPGNIRKEMKTKDAVYIKKVT